MQAIHATMRSKCRESLIALPLEPSPCELCQIHVGYLGEKNEKLPFLHCRAQLLYEADRHSHLRSQHWIRSMQFLGVQVLSAGKNDDPRP